ncbi:Uu.00g080990.m01.CDS01 [Anthostomella pinea]|uniref:non-specific serine/threonine protein kinase n=1 Tax=Anthostomella pinea TaxID=933095 RepID=A0AAI8VL62_9PEZI|nr:Uu.00g080990.m01.CDS01 [Anthostomella pinea]
MASYNSNVPVARPAQQAVYGAPPPMQMQAPSAPAGTFTPGTKIQVGNHRVVIQKYLSEGGFAHVYLVKMPRPIDGTDEAVLKRVAVPDKETLRGMRTEVETMKRLKGHKPIVTYIDSHASEMKGGGYEVFLLMEFCNGGGLIDFMNTRLQHRLTEPEILNIFSDIAEGVACMHYLKPPLLHRDLKVENVLITMHGSKRKFKLCDFGSAAPPKPAPQTVVECRLMDEDVQRHTTMQYRSPEMVDVYRKQPIDEKSDIWALGVLLYKLCYYTTPFEDQGQLAILNASYKFPSYPVFSDRLKQLIASMLRENLASRPNIYQALRESCRMQGREVPIHDIYSNRSQPGSRTGENHAVAEQKTKSKPAVGAVYSPPPQQQNQAALPEIMPMRRGRPTTTSQAAPSQAARPSPSPMRVTSGDPFAALDSNAAAKAAADELSSRFPTLDQFALLHDHGAKFDFDSPTSPPASSEVQTQPSQQQVPDKVAQDAFARPQAKPSPVPAIQRQSTDFSRVNPVVTTTEPQRPSPSPAPVQAPASAPPTSEMSRASAIIFSNPELQAIASPPPQARPEPPSRPSMVSTGTMTSTPPPEGQPREYPPIHRFPPAKQHRSTSLPRQQRPEPTQAPRPSPGPRLPSMQSPSVHGRQPSTARPSLEGGRPSLEYLEPLANVDYLREREAAPRPIRSGHPSPNLSAKVPSPMIDPQDEPAIESNVDFLRSMEDSEAKKKEKGPKNHTKRSSLGSLSGTKNILAGRFGDAFKRFEGNTSNVPARTPSPLKDMGRRDLTPIAGSEATDGRSDDGNFLGEPELTPEMRRELEAQSLAEEERRVEAAAAEYRQRMAEREAGGSAALPKSIGGVSRAVSIQNRVQNLLDESQKSAQQVQRTASGYGKFSDDAAAKKPVEKQLPELPRKPVGPGRVPPLKPATSSSEALTRVRPANQVPGSPSRSMASPRPNPGPKPLHLNSIPTGGRPRSPPKQKQLTVQQGSSEQLVGVGMPGRPTIDMSFQEKEDYIKDFSKRFPSLSSIEMVERDIDAEADRQGGR